MPRKRRPRLIGVPGLLVGTAAGLLLIAAGVAVYAEAKLSQLVLGGLGESFSTRIYAAPFVLRDGAPSPPSRLLERLDRLGYAQIRADKTRTGQYFWHSPALVLGLRGFQDSVGRQDAGVFSLTWDGRAWSIKDSSGQPVSRL